LAGRELSDLDRECTGHRGTRKPGPERHFRHVPSGHCRELTIRALDVRFLHSRVDQSHDSAAEHKQIANLELLDEILLDRTKAAAAQHHVNEAIRVDGPNVGKELSNDSRMGQDAACAHRLHALGCDLSERCLPVFLAIYYAFRWEKTSRALLLRLIPFFAAGQHWCRKAKNREPRQGPKLPFTKLELCQRLPAGPEV